MAGRETKLKSGKLKLKSGKPKLRSRNRSQGVARLLWTGGGVGGGGGAVRWQPPCITCT